MERVRVMQELPEYISSDDLWKRVTECADEAQIVYEKYPKIVGEWALAYLYFARFPCVKSVNGELVTDGISTEDLREAIRVLRISHHSESGDDQWSNSTPRRGRCTYD